MLIFVFRYGCECVPHFSNLNPGRLNANSIYVETFYSCHKVQKIGLLLCSEMVACDQTLQKSIYRVVNCNWFGLMGQGCELLTGSVRLNEKARSPGGLS